MERDAHFHPNRKHRYALWRIWDKSRPLVMFIGLNPSTANEGTDDPTIRRVISFAKDWGFGGVYMVNLFSQVTAYPKELRTHSHIEIEHNLDLVKEYARKCNRIVFAWGNFKEAWEIGRRYAEVFENSYALQINKNGSPKHPLYVRADIEPVKFNPS